MSKEQDIIDAVEMSFIELFGSLIVKDKDETFSDLQFATAMSQMNKAFKQFNDNMKQVFIEGPSQENITYQ